MSIKEMALGRDWENKTAGEKIARASKGFDIFTTAGALVMAGVAPVIAAGILQANVVTFAGANIYEASAERGKKD